jgi:hydrogenase maturation factor HypF (carbamoyltransferase family)
MRLCKKCLKPYFDKKHNGGRKQLFCSPECRIRYNSLHRERKTWREWE